jgi:hypothetical protein
MVELDSLLWQGAKWRAPEEVASWLVDGYGIAPPVADRIGRLFHGNPDALLGAEGAVHGGRREKPPSSPDALGTVITTGRPN